MPRTITLIRHGEAQHNLGVSPRISRVALASINIPSQGPRWRHLLDPELTADGIAQSLSLAQEPATHLPVPDLILTSPLLRAIQTTLLAFSPLLDENASLRVLVTPLAQEIGAFATDRSFVDGGSAEEILERVRTWWLRVGDETRVESMADVDADISSIPLPSQDRGVQRGAEIIERLDISLLRGAWNSKVRTYAFISNSTDQLYSLSSETTGQHHRCPSPVAPPSSVAGSLNARSNTWCSSLMVLS